MEALKSKKNSIEDLPDTPNAIIDNELKTTIQIDKDSLEELLNSIESKLGHLNRLVEDCQKILA